MKGINPRSAKRVIALRKKVAKGEQLGFNERRVLKKETKRVNSDLRDMVRDIRSRDE